MKPQKKTAGGLINLAAFLPASRSNGPGLRAVLWVQGCDRRCPGCFNPDMQEFREKQVTPVAALTKRICALEGIEGVTFSGGEPFAQAEALARLAEQLTVQGLNIVIFTGYTFTELTSQTNPAWQHLLAAADLLIAGPYREDLPSQEYLLGSANQQVVFLTDKLKCHPDFMENNGQTMEVIVDVAGNVITTGLVR